MLERLTTPREAYQFKLGAALTMEDKVLDILQAGIDEARDDRVADAFRQHLEQSKSHCRNIEEALRLLDAEVDDAPCPAIDGLKAEGKANAKKTDKSIIDIILLQGAVEVEHHEIGVYENLILNAKVMGHKDVADVLQRNLDDERETLHTVRALQEQVAAITPKDPARGSGLVSKVKSALS